MIEWLIITTLWIWGVRAIFTHPFIFWQTGNWIDKTLPRWLAKPLIRCPVCMSSIWGTYFFLYSDQRGLINWVIFLIALAGISYLIVEYLYPEDVESIQEEEKKS